MQLAIEAEYPEPVEGPVRLADPAELDRRDGANYGMCAIGSVFDLVGDRAVEHERAPRRTGDGALNAGDVACRGLP